MAEWNCRILDVIRRWILFRIGFRLCKEGFTFQIQMCEVRLDRSPLDNEDVISPSDGSSVPSK